MTDHTVIPQTNCTAAEAGWQVSRYNMTAAIPGSDDRVILNLFSGKHARCSPYELYLMDSLDQVSETHPLLGALAGQGFIVNFDERAALETMGRYDCADSRRVSLMICTTMGCNFDCPYCFEDHQGGKMPEAVRADVIALTERLLKTAHPETLFVNWFGGEPLLAPDVIETLSEKLIALSSKYGAEYTARITTNGYLLDQETVDMLDRAQVKKALITLDGIGPAHDATRHLRGGGPTFERIIGNLRDLRIPFRVYLRQNVHEGNLDQVEGLKTFVEALSRESGNRLFYGACPVFSARRSQERGFAYGENREDPGLWAPLVGEEIPRAGGTACPAQKFYFLAIDERGNLYKCPVKLGDPNHIFGTAADWEPADPLKTAAHPDRLTSWVNTSAPIRDQECWDCVWLPQCRGGCAADRLAGSRPCVPWKNDPERFIQTVVGCKV